MHAGCVAAAYSDLADIGEDGCSIAKALETHECDCNRKILITFKVNGKSNFNPETKQN